MIKVVDSEKSWFESLPGHCVACLSPFSTRDMSGKVDDKLGLEGREGEVGVG